MKQLLSAIVLIVSIVLSQHTVAQAPQTLSSSDILLGIKKLNVLGSVLYVGAHPDDENTRLLAWLSKEKLYRTGYLSLTRGDGGQNLIGNEQGINLGLIRTQELLAARRIDGAEQFFSTAFDFGFSKTSDETFKIWNKEKILADVVWVIRKFQPDVIITRFPEDTRAGHGHHAASAILAREAFSAAADPNRFPDQLKRGVKVWQAKRILWNTFNFGGTNTTAENQLKIDVGSYNALLGKSYGEIAAEGRSQHKSQGFGVPKTRGQSFEYFTTVAGDPPVTGIMDGVDISWARTGAAKVADDIQQAIQQYDIQQPGKSIYLLQKASLDAFDHNNTTEDSPLINRKLTEIMHMTAACSGLFAEAVASKQMAVTGDSIKISFNVVNRSKTTLKKITISYRDTTFTFADSLPYNQAKTIVLNSLVKQEATEDQPYWLKEQMTEGSYTVKDQREIGLPQNNADVVQLYTRLDTVQLYMSFPLQYKYTDPVKGEIYEPVITVSPVLVKISPAVILTNTVPKTKPQLSVDYETETNMAAGPASIVFSNGAKQKINISPRVNETQTIVFPFDSIVKSKKDTTLAASIVFADKYTENGFANYMRLINYDHIPTVHYLFQSRAKIINDEVKTEGKRIGYIKGAGDNVPDALTAMGYEVVYLEPADINEQRLKTLDAVITGVRAYNTNEYLSGKYDVLMKYVENGGNLIVQYNTSSQIGPVRAKISPYPFDISRNRITDERAAVKILKSNHPVLNYPNKITDRDFEGWIQERSIYHASNWDSHYETIFAMHDPGENDDEGGLITAKYGKGNFVYTGLVFFRELPAGVPGAYRLLANLIALNHKKGF
ncbi:MAG: PIG-L family deacetylase [Chitinophagaceae bacterium]